METLELDTIELQFFVLEELCKQYGYTAKDVFGEFHIYTKFEAWKFTPVSNNNAKTQLMHGNEPGNKPNNWHIQFRDYASLEEIVRYVHEHEAAKYGGKRICFTTNFQKKKVG